MYLLLVYLMTLSVAQNTLHQMQNDLDRMWKEVVCINYRYSPAICLERMNTMKNFSQESKCLVQGLSPGSLEYYARQLLI